MCWITSPNLDKTNKPVKLYFRKNFVLAEQKETYILKITADTRYKLYVNGSLCQVGPSKGDDQIWFYDPVDISSLTVSGKNVLAVEVLYYPTGSNNRSLFSMGRAGLFIEGEDLCSDESWRAAVDPDFQIVSENPYFAPLQIYEEAKGNLDLAGWKNSEYKDDLWERAITYDPVQIQKRENLARRTIPFMSRRERFLYFKGRKFESMEIPPCTKSTFDLEAGELTTGYLKLSLEGGAKAQIELLQAECYVEELPQKITSYDDLPVKGDRTKSVPGLMMGNTDKYTVAGYGTNTYPEEYAPFWFRTFRYIRVSVETFDEPLRIHSFQYEETGYPLEVHTRAETSDPDFSEIWDISERSLRRCMHETYEDCPFYEQLQYVMDSRSQMLYTYAVSADDRLARKTLDDFARAQRPDGLLPASYPNTESGVIPGFSIYYIGMLHDHMMYFGDKSVIEKYIPTADRILTFFKNHTDDRGLVVKVGDLNRPDCNWSFIDWTSEWRSTNGVPGAALEGPITMESLLYVLGLQYAVDLCDYLGKADQGRAYAREAQRVRKGIREYCMGQNDLIQDGPGIDFYSQHCQVFGVLTDTLTVEEGRENLLETLKNKTKYAQCSVAMMYYLFRALEKCDCYDETAALWDIWRKMIADHMTTCAEDPLLSRSDCHAWGALALYEFPAKLLGVEPAAPGFEAIRIHPHTEFLNFASGSVMTPRGSVAVSWNKSGEQLKVDYRVPDGVPVQVYGGSGSWN